MEQFMQALKTALGNYGLTQPLKNGTVVPERFTPLYPDIKEIVPEMRRMCRGLEYDICEMAFTTYLCARAAGLPFTAVPVFVTRNFHHWAISINAKSDIRTPKDLEGRVVGVNRGYTVTTGLWARGILQSEYCVDLDKVTFVPTDDEHVLDFKAPKNVDYARFRGRNLTELLERQEIDAAIGEMKAGSPDIKQLIPDARNAAYDYFRRTGVYPINHGLVVKNDLLMQTPWLADELVDVFTQAKAIYLTKFDESAGISTWDKAAADNAKVVGDPFPLGIEPNRKALETMTQFALDQHMIPRRYSVEELFTVN
jgi:4,5-dihydroxyphthalate decarboxylase